MPDDRISPPVPPAGWRDAFAALPLETPEAGGWQRIERARIRPRRAPRRMAWAAAIAAALAVVALLSMPLSRQQRAADPGPLAQAQRTSAQEVRPASRGGAGDRAADVVPAEPLIARAPTPTSDRARPAVRPADTGATTLKTARQEVDGAPDRRQASAADRTTDDVAAAPATPAATDPLENLYAESAQLEAVLAMARDERVASGAAAALASDFDAQVARIDAALVQPGITDARRTELWRDRVDALRGLAAFESTRRLLAAQGERYDARLVAID